MASTRCTSRSLSTPRLASGEHLCCHVPHRARVGARQVSVSEIPEIPKEIPEDVRASLWLLTRFEMARVIRCPPSSAGGNSMFGKKRRRSAYIKERIAARPQTWLVWKRV